MVSGQWSARARGVRLFVTNPQPPASSLSAASSRRAFTLTELLVVIAIIAVLAAMVSVGVMRALDTAKQTRIKTEVDQLDAAFKAYREKYGSFPPSLQGLAGSNALIQHIARAFPAATTLRQLGRRSACVRGSITSFAPTRHWFSGSRDSVPIRQHPFVTPGPTCDLVRVGALRSLTAWSPNPTSKVAVPLFDFDSARLAVVDSNPSLPRDRSTRCSELSRRIFRKAQRRIRAARRTSIGLRQVTNVRYVRLIRRRPRPLDVER